MNRYKKIVNIRKADGIMERNIKFSVPSNYVIVEEHGVKGLIRVSNKIKPVVILDKENYFIAVTKSYGRIFLIYRTMVEEAENLENFHLSKLNYDEFNGIIVDLKVGENCIYANLFNRQRRALEWVRINKDFQVDVVFGDIVFTDQFLENSMYIPIGVKYLNVIKEGSPMTLDIENNVLINGTASEVVEKIELRKVRKKNEKEEKKSRAKNDEPVYKEFPMVKRPAEEPVTHYEIDIDEDGVIAGLNAKNGFKVIGGSAIGEAIQFSPVIKAMVGGDLKLVDKEVGDVFFDVLGRIEHYGNGLALAVLYRYVSGLWKNSWGEKTHANVLRKVYDELSTDWEDVGGLMMKFYSSGSVIIGMTLNSEGRAVVTPYQIMANDTIIGDVGVEAIRESYVANGEKAARLKVTGHLSMEQDVPADYVLPTCIGFRKALVKDIKNYTYETIRWHCVKLAPEKSNKQFEMCFNIAEKFTYLSKKKVNGKVNKNAIRTNIMSMAFVEPYTDEELAEFGD